jgi:YYY domain-containing protein
VVSAVVFWLLAVGLGIAALPLAELLFPRLPSRGLVFARPLGLLLVAFPVWLLASVGLVAYGRPIALVAVGALAALGLAVGRRTATLLRREAPTRRIFLAGELVFTGAFAACALMRSFSPDVWQTEKPMDMALINAVNRADSFPPADPWQSGAEVNYYYFGHYLVAFLVRVTGVEPAVGFNLAVALFFALVASGVFGLAATLYDAGRRSGDAPPRSLIAVGLVSAAFALLLGNLAGGSELFANGRSLSGYDWFAPSRVIEGTANEFPFFSFLLADLHAHVMVTPLTLVAVAYAVPSMTREGANQS